MSPAQLIVLQGMKRSGNHALVSWLEPQFRFTFFNNVIPIAPILSGEVQMPEPVDYRLWSARADLKGCAALVSIEDHDLSTTYFRNIDVCWQRVLIVRHPENLFSSRVRKAFLLSNHPAYPQLPGHLLQRVVAIWKQHVRAYLMPETCPDRIAVYFDVWARDRAYRQALSSRLGVDFQDSGLERVPEHGGGSSFDGVSLDGNASAMRVTERKDCLEPHELQLLQAFYADPEVMELGVALEQADHFELL
jgi:hypothetical protein